MRFVLAGVASALFLFAACGGDEEEFAATSTTPTTAPTAAPTDGTAPTPTAAPSVPADWLTFTSPDGLFTLRYPPSWFLEIPPTPPPSPQALGWGVGYLFSFDRSDGGPKFPDNGAKVDLEVSIPAPGYDCRVQPSDALVATLGGVEGWRVDRALSDVPGSSVTAVRAYAQGYCFKISGYFGPNYNDQGTFDDIVGSWVFAGATQ